MFKKSSCSCRNLERYKESTVVCQKCDHKKCTGEDIESDNNSGSSRRFGNSAAGAAAHGFSKRL